MSYESTNYLPNGTKLTAIVEFLASLGFVRYPSVPRVLKKQLDVEFWLAEFEYFEVEDYKSWTGVTASIFEDPEFGLVVSTRSAASRSYYDLKKQNQTIRELRRRFGGSFETDAGKGRYIQLEGLPPSPMQSGCYLAFERFEHNVRRASIYLGHRDLNIIAKSKPGVHPSLDEINPFILSNNLLLPYMVAILEDYFKSTFLALLHYSDRKIEFLKGARLSPENLVKVSDGEITIEEALLETMPFQRIDATCQNFKKLDSRLDFWGVLNRPFRRRKRKLIDVITSIIAQRHEFIHRGRIDIYFSDEDLVDAFLNLDAAVQRCYIHLHQQFGWPFCGNWSRPIRGV